MISAVYVLLRIDLGDPDIVGIYRNRKDAIDDRIRLEMDKNSLDEVYIIQEYVLR